MKSIIEMANDHKKAIKKEEKEAQIKADAEITNAKRERQELDEFVLSVFKEVDGVKGIKLVNQPDDKEWTTVHGWSAEYVLRQRGKCIAAAIGARWDPPEYNSDYGCDVGGAYYVGVWVGQHQMDYYRGCQEKFREEFAKHIAKFL